MGRDQLDRLDADVRRELGRTTAESVARLRAEMGDDATGRVLFGPEWQPDEAGES